jgi:hypothetical protein
VVDLFKVYTFDFRHIFIRAIVWKKILPYNELLELLQNLRTRPCLLPPAFPSLFLCSAASRKPSAFPPAASCSLTAFPAPPCPYLACPPLAQPRWLLLAWTRHTAARLSRHARHRPPAAACHPPACLFLALERPSELLPSSIPLHAPAFLFFSPLDYFAGAPLSTAVNRLHRSSSPTSCSTSTAASHCPFLTRSSSSSRARSLERRAGDLSPHHRPISSRTEVPPLLLPRQEHHQHHISMPKLPNQFPFAFLHSGRQNTAAALRTSLHRLCF